MFFGELDDGVEFVFVVTDDGGFSAELLDVADEGEDEAVVVVDNKDAGHGTSLALMVDGDVQVEGAVLCEVGEDEFHEQVDYGEYQHDGDDDANPQGAGEVAENPCVHLLFLSDLGSCYGGGNFCGRSGCGGPPGFEAGVDNVSFGVAVARVAGGERQEALGGCYAGLSGDGFDDFYLVGLHDFVAVDGVGIVAVFGAHVDVVAFGEQVDVVEDFTAGLAVACEGEVADLSGHGASFVVAESEGVEHVGAGALGGGALVVGSELGDVDDAEDFTVAGFAQTCGRGVGVPVGEGFGGVGVEFLDEGADGLGLGAVGVDVGPPELPCDEEQQQEAHGDKEFACNLDDPVQHGAGAALCGGCRSLAHAFSFVLWVVYVLGRRVAFLIFQRTEKVKSSRKSAKIGVNIYF